MDGEREVEHELKCWPEFFQAIIDGRKPFELRRADRGYAVGHTLWLREWEPGSREYTGRELRRKITYMVTGVFGLEPGYSALGLSTSRDSVRNEALEEAAAHCAKIADSHAYSADPMIAGKHDGARQCAREVYALKSSPGAGEVVKEGAEG